MFSRCCDIRMIVQSQIDRVGPLSRCKHCYCECPYIKCHARDTSVVSEILLAIEGTYNANLGLDTINDSQGNSEVEKLWNGDGLTPLTRGHTQAMTMTRAKTMTKTLTNYREFKIMVSGLFYTLLVLIGAVTFGAIHLSNILPETYRTRFSASLISGRRPLPSTGVGPTCTRV